MIRRPSCGARTRPQSPLPSTLARVPFESKALPVLERALCRCPVCASWGDVEGDLCGTCDGEGWVRRRDLPRLWERARRHGHRCLIPPPRLPDVADPNAIVFDATVDLHDGTCETPWIIAVPNGPSSVELATVYCDVPEGALYLLLSPQRRDQLAERAAEARQDARAAA